MSFATALVAFTISLSPRRLRAGLIKTLYRLLTQRSPQCRLESSGFMDKHYATTQLSVETYVKLCLRDMKCEYIFLDNFGIQCY